MGLQLSSGTMSSPGPSVPLYLAGTHRSRAPFIARLTARPRSSPPTTDGLACTMPNRSHHTPPDFQPPCAMPSDTLRPTMESLRLPPLNFNVHQRPSLNCALPPISPLPHLTPLTPATPNYPEHHHHSSSLELPPPSAIASSSSPSPQLLSTSASTASLHVPSPHTRITLNPITSPCGTSPQPIHSPMHSNAYLTVPPYPPATSPQPNISPMAPITAPASHLPDPLIPTASSSGALNHHPAIWATRSQPMQPIETHPRSLSVPDMTETAMSLRQIVDHSSTSDLSADNALTQNTPTNLESHQPPPKGPIKKTINTPRGVREVYACPYDRCARVSTEHSNMKAHMRMHTGERPYVCPVAGCAKSFKWKSSLTYHERALHTKARPYKCIPCRKSFVEKRKLKMHHDLCPAVRAFASQPSPSQHTPNTFQ